LQPVTSYATCNPDGAGVSQRNTLLGRSRHTRDSDLIGAAAACCAAHILFSRFRKCSRRASVRYAGNDHVRQSDCQTTSLLDRVHCRPPDALLGLGHLRIRQLGSSRRWRSGLRTQMPNIPSWLRGGFSIEVIHEPHRSAHARLNGNLGSCRTGGHLAKRLPGKQDGRRTAWRSNNQCRMNTS
jgi:hypothetical protein